MGMYREKLYLSEKSFMIKTPVLLTHEHLTRVKVKTFSYDEIDKWIIEQNIEHIIPNDAAIKKFFLWQCWRYIEMSNLYSRYASNKDIRHALDLPLQEASSKKNRVFIRLCEKPNPGEYYFLTTSIPSKMDQTPAVISKGGQLFQSVNINENIVTVPLNINPNDKNGPFFDLDFQSNKLTFLEQDVCNYIVDKGGNSLSINQINKSGPEQIAIEWANIWGSGKNLPWKNHFIFALFLIYRCSEISVSKSSEYIEHFFESLKDKTSHVSSIFNKAPLLLHY